MGEFGSKRSKEMRPLLTLCNQDSRVDAYVGLGSWNEAGIECRDSAYECGASEAGNGGNDFSFGSVLGQ